MRPRLSLLRISPLGNASPRKYETKFQSVPFVWIAWLLVAGCWLLVAVNGHEFHPVMQDPPVIARSTRYAGPLMGGSCLNGWKLP